jgi:hypothetical protein
MLEEEVKYILEYKSILNDYFKKSLNLQLNIGTKLGIPPDEYKNAKWLDYSPIINLTQQIPKIIQKQIENNKNFMDEIEKNIKHIDNFLKEKGKLIKKYEEKYNDVNEVLIKKYIEVEKYKIPFLNSISKSEDIISKFYENKKSLEDNKNSDKKEELNLLIDKNKEYELQKKTIIKETKKLESEYLDVVKNSGKYEDKFLKQINESISGIKDVCLEITDKIKDIVIIFSESLRDSFKSPLDVIDKNIKELTSNNIKENMDKAMIKTFNNEQKFSNIIPVKYELRSLIIVENYESRFSFDSKGSKGSKGKKSKKKKKENDEDNKGMVRFEDGFEEMTYFEDDCTLYTAQEIFNNFNLIVTNGLNIKLELDKNTTKNIISKILSNMQNYKPGEINSINKVSDEEINQLKNLLKDHSNRVIFLHKLNDYRSLCLYELQDEYYKLFGDIFNYIIDVSVKENDYHCVEMVIILSKTYYILMDKKNKIYIQNLILNNECFKSKNFWEELLVYSISKEVVQSVKRDNIPREDEKKIKTKNDNIIFSQLLSIIDNMFDFGVDGNLVKEIIEPKIQFYKVDDKLSKTINDVMNSKSNPKNKKGK